MRSCSDITQQYPQADAIFHTGDLAQVPVAATYQRYLKFMQALNIPHYQIPGNHDDAEGFPFYMQCNQVHAIELGNWCVILLNTAGQKPCRWLDGGSTVTTIRSGSTTTCASACDHCLSSSSF